MLLYIIVAVIAFLLGSIPFGYIFVLVFRGEDVRQTGSGNIGATNVARTGSKGLAIATLLLDAMKGSAAVLFAFSFGKHALSDTQRGLMSAAHSIETLAQAPGYLQIEQHLYVLGAIAALFAILGHIFTPWLGFKGGKGVATGLGVFLALAPKAVLVVLLIFAVIVLLTRYISLASMLAAACFPIAFFFLYRQSSTPAVIAMTAGVSLLIIYRHKDNIRRLMAGNENRFGSKKS